MRDRRALRLDLPGDLSAALADPGGPAQGPVAAMAGAIRPRHSPGVRGIVSLAAALAIPLHDGERERLSRIAS